MGMVCTELPRAMFVVSLGQANGRHELTRVMLDIVDLGRGIATA